MDLSNLQYGAWFMGKVPTRGGGESTKFEHEEGRYNRGWSVSKLKGGTEKTKHA